jgi:autotransporter-associated beta strand protein
VYVTFPATVNIISSFTKVGGGTLTLTGNSTYNGITTVSEGTLLVNGSPTGGGAYTVNSGATLGGTGNIGTSSVTVDAGGFLAPGASIGTFTVGGDTTINGTLNVEYDGDADTIDLLNVTGMLDITNATVSFANLEAGLLEGGPHIFAAYGSLIGFGMDNEFNMVSGLPSNYDIDYQYMGNQIALVASGGLPGDYNLDGKVDAADYVTWRKNPGGFPLDAYDTWRANFGNPPGSGSGLGDTPGSVPEPASVGLLLCAVFGVLGCRTHRVRCGAV